MLITCLFELRQGRKEGWMGGDCRAVEVCLCGFGGYLVM